MTQVDEFENICLAINESLDKAQEDLDGFDIFDYTDSTAKYAKFAPVGDPNRYEYTTLGLCGETGELANKVKKIMRDHDLATNSKDLPEDILDSIFGELGDIYWYWVRCCKEFGFDPFEVIVANHIKLQKRMSEGKIGGSGDNR